MKTTACFVHTQGLRDVSELYNDFAQPLKMWNVCLRLVDFSGSAVEPSFIRQLWDHHLIQVCACRRNVQYPCDKQKVRLLSIAVFINK